MVESGLAMAWFRVADRTRRIFEQVLVIRQEFARRPVLLSFDKLIFSTRCVRDSGIFENPTRMLWRDTASQ